MKRSESLVDLLLDGQFRDHLQRQVDFPSSKKCDPRVKNTCQPLNNRAVTYISSDWKVRTYTYADLIKYCHSVSDQLSTLAATSSFTRIENVSTDDNDSETLEVPPVLVLYGDCAHLTPVFMISANLVGFAFYSVDQPEQLKEATRKLPTSTLFASFICHKYRLNELKHLLGGDYQSLVVLEDYCLIYLPNKSQKSVSENHLDIAYLINTSGTSSSITESTPASKHIFVPHTAIVRNILDFKQEYSLTSTDVVFLCSPFTFDPSICDTFLALSSYAHLVIASSTARNSSTSVQRIFTTFGVTYTTCTPSVWHKLFTETNAQLLKSLRYINFGGELSLPLEEIKSSILSYNPSIRVYNLFGLTEVSAWASMFPLNLDYLNVITAKHHSDEHYYLAFLPILGRPLLDTTVYLEDEQLVIESTARRCLILATDNRWTYKSKYYTGDCGHQLKESGFSLTYYLRRNCQTDFVKINGVKCYLPSIELSICDKFRNCTDFQVIQCTALSGDWHEIKVVDLVIQLGHQTVSFAQVKRTILSHLSHQPFAFRCHFYDQSTISSILGSNGKLDHGKLRRQLVANRQSSQIDDSNEIESTVHSIIASALGVDLKVIRDNKDKALHHLGAASMAALQISIQIDQTFASRLTKNEPHNLFETVITKNVGVIVEYVRRLVSIQSDSNFTAQDEHQNVENAVVVECVDIDKIPQTFTISHHCQLRKGNQLDETKGKQTEPVSISHQWSLFMEECVDATPLIVQYGQVMYLVAASHSGIVIALDPFTTSEPYCQLWSTQLSNRIESSPIASTDGSLVFIGDYSGHLTALQTNSGSIVWSYKTGDFIKCTPTIYGHLVICGSHDRHLYCWQDSGQLQWKVDLANLAIFSSPVVHDGARLLCCTYSGTVASVALSNGVIQWKQSVSKSPIFSTPLLVENTAVIGLTDDAIVSISLADGNTCWRIPTDGPIVSSPVAFQAESITSAIIGTQGKSILCFNAHTGDQLWRHQTSSVMYSSPFLVGHTAILVETDAILHLLDCRTGKPISVKTGGPEKVSRSEQYQMATNDQIFSSPIWHNGKLFIGARDSCLHCFAIDL